MYCPSLLPLQRGGHRAGLPTLRVHDLKHTFGRRLRAAGVSFENRQDLLGHKSGRITTHYSAAELSTLIDAANRAVKFRKTPALTILHFARGRVTVCHRQSEPRALVLPGNICLA